MKKSDYLQYCRLSDTLLREKIASLEAFERTAKGCGIDDEIAQRKNELKAFASSVFRMRKTCEEWLDVLPEIEARVLYEYYLQGRTISQIQRITHYSRTGVVSIKARALNRLQGVFDGSTAK